MTETRSYNSPLRDEQAQATRAAILDALFALMGDADAPDDITTDAIARAAGVQRRTVHRHFPTRDDLFAAFWPWINARIGAASAPATLADILDGPTRAFPRFDAHEPVIRAALHSRTGRAMRLSSVPARQEAFARLLGPVVAHLPPDRARMVTALAHLLFSASAWETLKDYGGLTGAQAGQAASWALGTILSAIAPGDETADPSPPLTETRDER